MEKPIMKLLTLTLSAVLVTASASAAPLDSVRQDNSIRRVVITGTVPAEKAGQAVTIALLPAEKADLENPAFSDFSYLKQINVDSDGTYEVAFELDQPSGDYVARVLVEGEEAPAEMPFVFYSFAEADALLPQINASDAAGLAELLASNQEVLGIADGLYGAMRRSGQSLQEVYDAVAQHGDFADIPEFLTYLEGQLLLAASGSGDTAVAELLVKENQDLFAGLHAYEAYGQMTAQAQAVVYEKLAALEYASEDGLADVFAQAVLLAQVQTSQWQDVLGILNGTLDSGVGLDLDSFNSRPTDVAKAVAGESYPSIAKLQDAMDEAAEEPAQSGGSSGRPSGGSSGGGGSYGGGYTNTVEPTVEPDPDRPAEEETGFQDLAGYDWAQESILSLADMGVINGVGDGMFAPGNNVTREEFVAMLVRAFEMDEATDPADFADVPTGAWFHDAVATAQKNGIVNGVGDGFFGVGRPITRQKLAKMAYFTLEQVYGVTAAGDSSRFSDDATIADYAKASVGAMAQLGIINGFEDGSFRPLGNATRAEAAKIIFGMLQQVGGIDA